MTYAVVHEISTVDELRIHTPTESYGLLKNYIEPNKSQLYIITLGYVNKLLSIQVVDIESLTNRNKEVIFGTALSLKSEKIIIAHNKISEGLEVTDEDIEITKYLITVGSLNGVKVLDYEIISANGFYSLAENKVVDFHPRSSIKV